MTEPTTWTDEHRHAFRDAVLTGDVDAAENVLRRVAVDGTVQVPGFPPMSLERAVDELAMVVLQGYAGTQQFREWVEAQTRSTEPWWPMTAAAYANPTCCPPGERCVCCLYWLRVVDRLETERDRMRRDVERLEHPRGEPSDPPPVAVPPFAQPKPVPT